MLYADIAFVHVLQEIIEILGTLAFAISGIRHAAAKHYDWFGGFVCGIAVAIGGGTLRDVMLGVTPFWMTSPLYIVCTLLAQTIVIVFSRSLKKLDNAWLAFDTLGLALFTIAGIQKTLSCGHPFYWLMMESGVNVAVTVVFTFLMIVVIRFMAIKYHISLPVLKGEK